MFILSMIFCSICVFGLYPDMKNFPEIYLSKSYHIIYQSLSRTVWGLALGLIILISEANSGGYFHRFIYFIVLFKIYFLNHSRNYSKNSFNEFLGPFVKT